MYARTSLENGTTDLADFFLCVRNYQNTIRTTENYWKIHKCGWYKMTKMSRRNEKHLLIDHGDQNVTLNQ